MFADNPENSLRNEPSRCPPFNDPGLLNANIAYPHLECQPPLPYPIPAPGQSWVAMNRMIHPTNSIQRECGRGIRMEAGKSNPQVGPLAATM